MTYDILIHQAQRSEVVIIFDNGVRVYVRPSSVQI